jgi:hypothetical protein
MNGTPKMMNVRHRGHTACMTRRSFYSQNRFEQTFDWRGVSTLRDFTQVRSGAPQSERMRNRAR